MQGVRLFGGWAVHAVTALLLATPITAGSAPVGPRPYADLAPPASPVFAGLGAWVDRYDYAIGRQLVTPATVDVIADSGVQTLYLQAATPDGGLLAPGRQKALIARAKSRGLRVVSWYLPTTEPLSRDMVRIKAMVDLKGVDGFAVDAESTAVRDVGVRNDRLVELLRRTRALTTKPIGMITPSPTAMDLWAKKSYWPDYPFERAAPYVDAYLPMTYWAWHRQQTTARKQIVGDVTRLRAMPAVAKKPIHVIGLTTWRSDARTLAEVVRQLGVSGGSLYDWLTTPVALRKPLRALRGVGT